MLLTKGIQSIPVGRISQPGKSVDPACLNEFGLVPDSNPPLTTLQNAVIWNPLVRLTTSEPVVTVTLDGPTAAVTAMEMFIVRAVGPATATLFTVMPWGKETVVTPWTK